MLRLIPALCSMLFLGACNTVTPYVNVYDGLLPAGYQIRDSPDAIRTELLKGKSVVLVTSTNFNNYTTEWQNYHEKGGDEQHKALMRGVATVMTLVNPLASIGSGISSGVDAIDSDGNRVRQASDPRNVVDRVYSTLRPYFKSVRVAADFAEAQDLKADYIALIDYYGTFNEMGSMYRTKGGVYMMDGALRRVFQSEGQAEVVRPEPSFFSGVSEVIQITARTYAKRLDITTNQIHAGVRTKLGSAPR